MRLRGATTDLENAGLDTEGMADSTAKLREEMMALSGVDIMQDDDTFKSTTQILRELAGEWSNLTDIQQASVTELVAGKRQGNIMSALMTNWSQVEAAIQASENSAGSAMKEQTAYSKSLQYSLDRGKAAFQEFSNTVFTSDFLKNLTDIGVSGLEGLTQLISGPGGLNTVLGGLGIYQTAKGGGKIKYRVFG